ncbi:MAG: hypothetical protein IJW50_08055 [Clostridia bacterium]|nr:hypothetical protein [Clostridia bacterium]
MALYLGRQRLIASPIIAKGAVYLYVKNHGLFLYDSRIWIYFVVVSQSKKVANRRPFCFGRGRRRRETACAQGAPRSIRKHRLWMRNLPAGQI